MPHNYERPPSPQDFGQDGEWPYTMSAEDVARLRQQLEMKNDKQPRPTIGRDTAISGGVYEGRYGGEAIVVDADKYPALNAALEEVKTRITSADGTINKHLALTAVFKYVSEHMKYSKPAVRTIFETRARGVDGTKVALDVYINAGVGVCRHQALFAGALFEGLVKEGILSGRVSVDRNRVKHDNDDEYDGHAWTRYTNSAGEVFIIDVAQERVGPLESFMAARRSGDRRVWDYGREEDHAKVRGRLAVAAALTLPPDDIDENGLIKVPDRFKT